MEKLDERSFKFAPRVVRLVSALPHEVEGQVLRRQLLRSGTSIGANVEDAYAAATQRDFTYKMNTALKEARETHYWLRLICEAGLLPAKRISLLLQEAYEIKMILAQTVITSKKRKVSSWAIQRAFTFSF